MRTTPGRWIRGSSAAVLTLAAVFAAQGGTVSAGPPVDFRPEKSPAAKLSLQQAIDVGIRNDPAIQLARQASLQSRGSAAQAAGLFDLHGLVSASIDVSSNELSPGARKAQLALRDVRRQAANEADRVADGLEQQLNSGQPFAFPPDCSSGTVVFLGQTPICSSGRERAEFALWDRLAANFSESALGQALEEAMRLKTEDIMDRLHALAFALRRDLRNLGTTPESETVTTLSFGLGLQKTYRTGIVFTPALTVESVKDNFDNKPASSVYGGKGTPDRTRSGIGFQIDVPLGKGRGATSVAAPERAATLQSEASLDQLGYTISVSALRTQLAYWQLVGAQQTQALLERSLRTEEQLLELGRALVEADQIAPADLTQVEARIAATRGSVDEARRTVRQARVALATTMGLAVETMDDAPSAADPFPEVPPAATVRALQVGGLIDAALAARGDLATSRKVAKAADLLAEAARVDLRRRVDLSLTAGYTGLHEGGSVTSAGDLWHAYREAFGGYQAGPSAALTVTVEWPFKNNVALGLYEQYRAIGLSAAIGAEDLKRVIGSETTKLVGSLWRVARQVEEARAAADFAAQSMAAETERFKLGEATAIDLLLTEESEIGQQLAFVAAQQQYASLVAQLRHQVGALVRYQVENGTVMVKEIQPFGLTFGGGAS